MIALAFAAPMPKRSRRKVSASAALRLTLAGCSVLESWAVMGVGASGLREGAAVVVRERVVRKAKIREVR